ncbi:MAG TPA: RsmB/NOP family class I SAM-dependent RNA methyltransferase [Opitutaceae bacterium]
MGNQRRVAAEFIAQLSPHVERDRALPARIERLLKGDRRLGSRDRRLYRELIYSHLRFRPWFPAGDLAARPMEALAWLAAASPATRAFREGVLGTAAFRWPAVPATLVEKSPVVASALGRDLPSLLPEWAAAECPVAVEPAEYEALHRRAPLWLRVRDPDDVPTVIADLGRVGISTAASGPLPTALRVEGETDVTRTEPFASGRIEVQDLGSQLILATAAPSPGEVWLDACAGAGGKSLQLAGLLGAHGKVWAHDIRPEALAELDARARRAGLGGRISRTPRGNPAAQAPYDGVLVDAPCSGSGTWRRAPHLKWSTSPAALEAAAALQADLLERFSPLVRPGGRLVYATCALSPRENEGQVAAFVAAQPAYRLELQRLFRPSEHDGDGFFVASLRRAP